LRPFRRCCSRCVYMCPHASIYVSSRRIYEHAVKVEALQALLLEVRHTTYYIYCVSSYYHIHTIYKSSYHYICCQSWGPSGVAHTILHCVHANIHVSSYYYIFVLILLHMCPHTTTYVSSYYYICVLMSHIWACCQSWNLQALLLEVRHTTYYIYYRYALILPLT
jgi:hypothetical protein